jgi:hypothetical protein
MARVQGELEAKRRWKNTKAGWDSSLRDHIGLIIDRTDVVQLIAAIGLTIAIHQVIMNSEELLIKARGNVGGIFSFASGPLLVVNLIKDWLGQSTPLSAEQVAALEELRKDPVPWVVSFGIAYFFINNGKEITDITKSVAGFFGMIPV